MTTKSRRAWIALGGNLGDRQAALANATSHLAGLPRLRILAATAPVETAPLGGLDQPDYLNAMLLVEWDGDVDELLAACQAIEATGARARDHHWASRTIDLDLVRVDGELCDRAALTLPHPGLRDRTFWAVQMAELESDA